MASGYKSTDPFAIRAALAHHLRFIKPDEASEIAEFGMHVSLYGLTPELRKHPQFTLLQNMKVCREKLHVAGLRVKTLHDMKQIIKVLHTHFFVVIKLERLRFIFSSFFLSTGIFFQRL